MFYIRLGLCKLYVHSLKLVLILLWNIGNHIGSERIM